MASAFSWEFIKNQKQIYLWKY